MKLNLISPFNNLGYGIVGKNILRTLVERGHDIAYFPVQPKPPFDTRQEESLLDETLADPFSVKNPKPFHITAPTLRIWHQNNMSYRIGSGLFYGMPIFELDRFNEQEKHNLRALDVILVNSKWAKQIVEKEVGGKVEIVNLGVDTSVYFPCFSRPAKTVFFNCGKWEVRKGHLDLLKAFNESFRQDDNVELWMMCDNPFDDNSRWENLYKSSKLGNKIKFLPRVKTQKDVAYIMNQVSCGVFPYKAEGWNLELLELMACGKPVIATNYSAPTEYINSDNCDLIEIQGLEPAHDGIWFHGQGNWATLDCKLIGEKMRKFYENDYRENHNGIKTAKKFTWENTVCQLEGIIG